ncbi:MAG: hypothetical protein R3C11_10990 [Planctomycetaceae bacterium]
MVNVPDILRYGLRGNSCCFSVTNLCAQTSGPMLLPPALSSPGSEVEEPLPQYESLLSTPEQVPLDDSER